MTTRRLPSTLLSLVLVLALAGPQIADAQTAVDDPVLVGAGDIAVCSMGGDEQTALLIDDIPGTVFTAGDNVYESGTAAQFKDCYGPSWGRFKTRTRPALGNHDYGTPGATPYFDYFGWRAGPPGQGYYSYDLGAWHIVVLNSSIDAREKDSYQSQWLEADLKAHPGACTLAYWHHPLFASKKMDDRPRDIRALWNVLYRYGADVIINGHVHEYERFTLLSPDGQPDPDHGIREFIAGTGGASLSPRPPQHMSPYSEAWNGSTWGVLKLTLHPASYDWDFIPVKGGAFHDSGSAQCVNSTSPVATPAETDSVR